MMLNFQMPSVSGDRRASIINNSWVVEPGPDVDLICPPNGRKISLAYENGDYFRVEFRSIETEDEFRLRFPQLPHASKHPFDYPITTVELSMEAAGTSWRLSPDATHVAGGSLGDNVMVSSTIAISALSRPILSKSFLDVARSTGWLSE